MGDYFSDWTDDAADSGDEFAPVDPFDGLTKRDQDIFFRVLDIIPDAQRGDAMDYFLDHPNKIRTVIDTVKKKKQLIEDKDVTGLRQVFDQERIQFEHAVNATQQSADY